LIIGLPAGSVERRVDDEWQRTGRRSKGPTRGGGCRA
jgi:hypothetical protein